ncbi:hypothetical protein QAD02_015451 [Eretmocerus hayati]|uniref:Uncharacterized protein n=1 Tax=Eretmocerus hayati TaxID=131215 RepID=A0ACC2P8Q9_9HYME|nr:hypothetical protein QAD02_015451 [Eretmocerus hayati]
MATSESDDFESADEDLNACAESFNRRKKYASIGSDSDDDVDFIPVQPKVRRGSNKALIQPNFAEVNSQENSVHNKRKMNIASSRDEVLEKNTNALNEGHSHDYVSMEKTDACNKLNVDTKLTSNETLKKSEELKQTPSNRDRKPKQLKTREVQSKMKKLGATKIETFPEIENTVSNEPQGISDQDESNLSKQKSCQESNVQNLCGELLTKQQTETDKDDKYHPVLEKLANSQVNADLEESWGAWGSWGVSSLINSASAGVSTLTSHVTQGFSLLEETMGVPDPVALAEDGPDKQPASDENGVEHLEESPSLYLPTFGFGDLMSSVNSITKYVESTSNRVISGGLDTLETIGKKTMEVLQEGDPGLKKKRALFATDVDKPILSQILREAKEKADIEEKSVEDKELSRKVHFESLFDDYQGLVHLEALEMLSKQCNMKIQNQLISLDESSLTSIQETLDEVKELCDLGDEDSDDDREQADKEFIDKLREASKDLGVPVTYDKLTDVWVEMNKEISLDLELSHRDIFQKAISALAKFTALSVERFHKTAELLLIKERRSTVNEADSLVQLTKILSSQIGSIANLYCRRLKGFKQECDESESNTSITSIFLEATNASSYIQEAFRLLIPILQVGAI